MERQRLTRGLKSLVQQKQAVLRPNGKTVKKKYLVLPLKKHEKPRYLVVISENVDMVVTRFQIPREEPVVLIDYLR